MRQNGWLASNTAWDGVMPASRRLRASTRASAARILNRNLLVYGIGGVIAPFIGIKLIDLVVGLIPGWLADKVNRGAPI